MIVVDRLTKYYGEYPAVRDVSFEVPKGRVVGFLGPNGAGKSTTMRIVAGFITATSGTARIDGKDVFWDPIEARRRIGYMPENCPLYPEMRVDEFLRFRGGLKGLRHFYLRIISTRRCLNSLPGDHSGNFAVSATFQPMKVINCTSSTAPPRSQSGFTSSETLW